MSPPIIYSARTALDMDPTPGQTTTIPHDAPSRSICAKASGFVAAHSGGALVLIIIMAIVIIFLYIRQTNFTGKGDHAHRRGVSLDEDFEADRLINSINAAAN